jgi:hypothetical protein
MKHEQQPFTNNSRRIATPILGFLSGKCRAAPITLRVIGVASFLPVGLCVSRTEAFLTARNTNYLNVYRDASAFHTVFMRCLFLVNVLLSLLYFRLIDAIYYGYSLFIKDLV